MAKKRHAEEDIAITRAREDIARHSSARSIDATEAGAELLALARKELDRLYRIRRTCSCSDSAP